MWRFISPLPYLLKPDHGWHRPWWKQNQRYGGRQWMQDKGKNSQLRQGSAMVLKEIHYLVWISTNRKIMRVLYSVVRICWCLVGTFRHVKWLENYELEPSWTLVEQAAVWPHENVAILHPFFFFFKKVFDSEASNACLVKNHATWKRKGISSWHRNFIPKNQCHAGTKFETQTYMISCKCLVHTG